MIRLEFKYGLIGYAIYNKILEKVFRSSGEFNIISDEDYQIYAKSFGLDLDVLKNLISFMREINLFPAENFISKGVLKRIKKIKSERTRKRKYYKNKEDKKEVLDVLNTSNGRIKPNKQNKTKEKKKDNSDYVFLPIDLNGIVSAELWEQWTNYRNEIKKPLSELSVKKQVEFLLKQPDPAECINSAIRNHWQGLFEVKSNEQKKADLPKPPVLSYDEMFGMPGGTT